VLKNTVDNYDKYFINNPVLKNSVSVLGGSYFDRLKKFLSVKNLKFSSKGKRFEKFYFSFFFFSKVFHSKVVSSSLKNYKLTHKILFAFKNIFRNYFYKKIFSKVFFKRNIRYRFFMGKGKRYGIFRYFFHQFFVLVGYHKPKRVRWHDRKIFSARFLVRVFRRNQGIFKFSLLRQQIRFKTPLSLKFRLRRKKRHPLIKERRLFRRFNKFFSLYKKKIRFKLGNYFNLIFSNFFFSKNFFDIFVSFRNNFFYTSFFFFYKFLDFFIKFNLSFFFTKIFFFRQKLFFNYIILLKKKKGLILGLNRYFFVKKRFKKTLMKDFFSSMKFLDKNFFFNKFFFFFLILRFFFNNFFIKRKKFVSLFFVDCIFNFFFKIVMKRDYLIYFTSNKKIKKKKIIKLVERKEVLKKKNYFKMEK
jgi:hypothetical protein